MRCQMNGIEDGNSYKALSKRDKVSCDFCDKTFKNRFQSIVHNASHIIIPLIKQSYLNCDICHSYINTQAELNTHKLIKHPEVCTKKEAVSHEASPERESTKEISYPVKNNSDKILDRLKFEDDGTNFNGILNDLVTECKVKVPICDLWGDQLKKSHGPSDVISNGIPKPEEPIKIEKKKRITDNLVFEDPLPDTMEHFVANDSEQNTESYSALVEPEIVRCRYCFTSFPNRFSLIQHEVVHIKISKGKPLLCLFCDKFIAGNHDNLKKHINKYHWEKKYTPIKTETCEKCGLKYRKYLRHLHNYHPEISPEKRDDEGKIMKVLKCCDFCISFFQHKINLKYIITGTTKDELGVRYACEFCGKLYFKLKLVQRHTKSILHNEKEIKRKTNEDRLKLIQKRLKRLKIKNK